MKKKIIAILIILIFTSGAAYHFYTVVGLKRKIKTLKYQQDISTALHNKNMKKDIDFYKSISERAVNLLNDEQIIELAKEEWKYSLLVNGKEFNGDGVKIEGNTLDMVVSENRSSNSLLPEELVMKGQIPNYFYKQIKVESEIPPEVTNKDGEYSTEVHYKFSYLSKGDKIKITLSDELKERLKLKNTKYIIYIK